MNKVVYVGELDQDIDDYIAILYLHERKGLKYVVLSPLPEREEGKKRKEQLENKGILFKSKIDGNEDTVVVGGALTPINEWQKESTENRINNLIIQGGYVGHNIYKELGLEELEKFYGKNSVRTFNFNLDVKSTMDILSDKSVKNIKNIYTIGKNVCHSCNNTKRFIWRELQDDLTLSSSFREELSKVKLDKRLHDLLAVDEALRISNNKETRLGYENVYPFVELSGKSIYFKWGSSRKKSQNFRKVKSAVLYK